MAGALQTAAGVAGGVVLGNMLTNMFSGSHPQEIVNIIEEKPQPDAASAQDSIAQDTTAGDDPFRRGDDQFLADNTGTTTSTPALATMILAAMTIAGFNPRRRLTASNHFSSSAANCCRSRCDKLSGPPV